MRAVYMVNPPNQAWSIRKRERLYSECYHPVLKSYDGCHSLSQPKKPRTLFAYSKGKYIPNF